MNIGTLKALLEGIDDDKEVRLVFQQSWPLQLDIYGVQNGCDTCNEDGEPLTCQLPDNGADGIDNHDFMCERAIYQQDEKLFCPFHGDVTELVYSDEELSDLKRTYIIACESSPIDSPYGNKSWWGTCRRYP